MDGYHRWTFKPEAFLKCNLLVNPLIPTSNWRWPHNPTQTLITHPWLPKSTFSQYPVDQWPGHYYPNRKVFSLLIQQLAGYFTNSFGHHGKNGKELPTEGLLEQLTTEHNMAFTQNSVASTVNLWYQVCPMQAEGSYSLAKSFRCVGSSCECVQEARLTPKKHHNCYYITSFYG